MTVLKYVGLERYCEQKREVRITYLEVDEVADTKGQFLYEKTIYSGFLLTLTPEILMINDPDAGAYTLELDRILDLFLVD